SNEAELNQMLDKIDSYKVDFVKITEITLQGPLFLKSVVAAKKRGYLVSGHVPIDLPIGELANAGFSSIEHASYILRLGSDEYSLVKKLEAGEITRSQLDQLYFKNFDQAKAIEGYKMLAEKKVAVTPTLIGGKQLAYLDVNDHKQDDFLKYLTKRFISNYQWRIGRMANETAVQKQERKDKYQLIASQVPLLQKAGVMILAGSDAAALNTFVYPAASLIEELELFQQAGMKPLNILQSATMNGALFMKKYESVGSIAVGKKADLILLPENPLKNISAVRNIGALVHKGKYYSKNELMEFLGHAKKTKEALDAARNE
ncbi:MAG: amidohydrolase family protein, partial [Chitinophagaceae bacterium]